MVNSVEGKNKLCRVLFRLLQSSQACERLPIDFDAVFSETHRSFRVAAHSSIPFHVARSNQLGCARSRAIAEFRESARQPHFFERGALPIFVSNSPFHRRSYCARAAEAGAAGVAVGADGAAPVVGAGAASADDFGASRFTAPYRAASHSRASSGL